VVASRDITIWEMDVTNPVGAVNPCPSRLAWLMVCQNGIVRTLRVVFSRADAVSVGPAGDSAAR
jgi:RNA polymerase sigma-70 factor (ECF subfamily)